MTVFSRFLNFLVQFLILASLGFEKLHSKVQKPLKNSHLNSAKCQIGVEKKASRWENACIFSRVGNSYFIAPTGFRQLLRKKIFTPAKKIFTVTYCVLKQKKRPVLVVAVGVVCQKQLYFFFHLWKKKLFFHLLKKNFFFTSEKKNSVYTPLHTWEYFPIKGNPKLKP